jgi:hypothetical protein
VLVDDADRTSDALGGEIGGLVIGPHQVHIEAPGKDPLDTWVVVKSKAATTLPVALADAPLGGGWVIAGGVSAVLVGGAVTVGVLYALGQSDVVVSAAVPSHTLGDVEDLRGKQP